MTKTKKFDPLFDQAIEFTKTKKFISVSTVQREIRIGYNRAAGYLEQMQKQGIIADGDIGGSVKVLVRENDDAE